MRDERERVSVRFKDYSESGSLRRIEFLCVTSSKYLANRITHEPLRYPVMITTRSRSRFEYRVRTPPPEVRNETFV